MSTPTQGPAAPPPAADPRTLSCPRCRATVAPDQDWCLRCGAPARTRLAPTPGWKAPLLAVGAFVAVACLAFVVAFVLVTDDPPEPAAAPQPAPAATTPGTPTTPGATTPGATTPGATVPGTTPPGTAPAPGAATTPGTTTPGTAADPGTTTPGTATTPGTTTPGATTPGAPEQSPGADPSAPGGAAAPGG